MVPGKAAAAEIKTKQPEELVNRFNQSDG